MSKNHKISSRFIVIFLIVSVFYLVLAGKLFYWQVIRAEEIKEIRDIQSTESLELLPKRGEILFSDNFPIATNNINYLTYANPKIIRDIPKYSNDLSGVLGYDSASISARLNQNLFWVRLGVFDHEIKKKVEDLDLEGIGFQIEASRFYPEASMAAHLVGFVGKNNDWEDQGYLGLEGYYERQLKGKPGKLYIVKDALGNPIVTDVREEKKVDGRTLLTSIDRTVQYIADEALKSGIEKYGAQGGSVIVMEPTTGKILAMSSVPKFDPQKYYEFDGDSYQNPIISNLYEPGSTFKVLIMAAALNEGLVRADTRCNICSSPVQMSGFTIKTWNDKYHPNSTMTEVIQNSDNTGMVFVGQKLGIKKMYYYLQEYGFGQNTGVDLQGEVSGSIRREAEWLPIDLATASFGQGISITPIQLLTAVSSIANGGYLLKPTIVQKIIDENGDEIVIKPESKRKVLSSNAAEVTKWIMVNAVENGDSKWVTLGGIPVAGKTGTAQIPVEGRYDPNQTIASFVGFFPADNPKVSMLVLVDRPKTSIYGSETAAPIFFSVARDIAQYYNIKPE
jgi:cell division protein FtsI/penicillin-binding protein 2